MITISFVIPVYNEEKRLKQTFKAVKELKGNSGLNIEEVIFVNDGSTDLSRTLLENFKDKTKAEFKIIVINYARNRGKGYAVQQGMLQAKSDYTLFFDADISTPLSQLSKFIPLMGKGADVIIGTRKNGKSTVIKHQTLLREFLGRAFTKISCFILQINISDITCGFKAFSKTARNLIFPQLKVKGWAYDAEIFFLANKIGLSTYEVPVIWSNKDNSKVNIHKAIPQTLLDLLSIHVRHGLFPTFSTSLKAATSPSLPR